MDTTVSEVLRFVEENGVKFVRLVFCDIFGAQKNIAIMPSQLRRAFGQGISFDASAVRGFLDVTESDLFLVPDPGTLSVLPWRPAQGRVVRFFCGIRYPDGRPFEGDGRGLLAEAAARAGREGFTCKFGPECEFYLFTTDEEGYPTRTPHDRAGYCDLAPCDRGENVRREICLTLEEMGLSPERSHHEQGPGQNEVDFHCAGPLEAADNLMALRMVVKAVAAKNGLYASFLPKPLEGASGSGLHVNLSLCREGRNLFDRFGVRPEPEALGFTAGILRRAREITAFLNPLANSYRRFGAFEAPGVVSWSGQNRSQLVRVPAAEGESSRIELRSPDPACNPYLAFTLLMEAGLEGVREGLELCPPADFDLYGAGAAALAGYERLPGSLGEALALASESGFIRRALPGRIVENFLAHKRREFEEWEAAEDKFGFELERYFGRT